MGHSQLGGETVLYLIDGLFGGYYADARPFPWGMWPFHWDWPSSLLASQDPVAIDSVGYDFVNAEWPDVVRYGHAPHPQYDLIGGAEDYLHEAALANDPCSGTFYDPDHAEGVQRLESLGVHEHWNDPVNKQYSRNLGAQSGIRGDLAPNKEYQGSPAVESQAFRRQTVLVQRLPDLRDRVRAMEKEIAELKERLSDRVEGR